MPEIMLNASMNNYGLFRSRRANKAFRRTAKKVLERDAYTCQYCGFQAKQYQEVLSRNQNYRDIDPKNLVTACCFCTQCFFLDSLGEGGYGGGSIIYLPYMSQTELNSLCHVLFCAMVNNTNYKDSAQAIYRTMRLRAAPVEERFGEGVSDPAVFGQLLLEYKINERKNPKKLLSKLRLLPSRVRFKKQVETWAEAALAEMTSS